MSSGLVALKAKVRARMTKAGEDPAAIEELLAEIEAAHLAVLAESCRRIAATLESWETQGVPVSITSA